MLPTPLLRLPVSVASDCTVSRDRNWSSVSNTPSLFATRMRFAASAQVAVTCVMRGSTPRAAASALRISAIFFSSESASGAGETSVNGGFAALTPNAFGVPPLPEVAIAAATCAAWRRFAMS